MKSLFKLSRKILLLTVVIIPSLTSCVQGDYELYDEYDLDYYTINGKRTKWGIDNVLYLPDSLLGATGCGYKAIKYVVGDDYTVEQIKSAMQYYCLDVEHYSQEYLAPAIMRLKGKIVRSVTEGVSSCVSVNDIICVPPMQIPGMGHMTIGHCTVVTNIIVVNNTYTYVRCYDGCEIAVAYINRVVKTSEL